MRRESSTVIALVGHVSAALTTALAASGNVAVVAAPAAEPSGAHGADGPWRQGAAAMRVAARRRATYVAVVNDPLTGVAAAWRDMWDVAAKPGAAAVFEAQASDTLAAWRSKQFELPDYYLVVAPAQYVARSPDLYLGPLRAARPRRIAVAATVDAAADPDGPAVTASMLEALRSLQHGPWWPPLDELLEAARQFHAGGLAETQQSRYS